MTRDMICGSCPIGCPLHVELDDAGKVLSVSGNTCKRGEKYAIDECTNPVRMLTSTIRVNGGALPVRYTVLRFAAEPHKELRDFRKVLLQPDETVRVVF